MSRIPNNAFMKMMECISALYRMEVISAEKRNELAGCLKLNDDTSLDALYTACSSLPDHSVVQELKETILFM
jgi:hypothetical protein